jgi:hypothetical protein
MRYGQSILLVGIILAFAASVSASVARIVEAVADVRDTTAVDLRLHAGHFQLLRVSVTLVPAAVPATSAVTPR